MKFRNYCIVALGVVTGIRDIIKEVSEVEIKFIEQTGVFISTFSSVMEPAELRELLNEDERTFFIFEVGAENSTYFVGRDDVHDKLFGHMENGGEEVLNMMTNRLMNEIHNMQRVTSGSTDCTNEEEMDVSNFTKVEKEEKINELLDKGVKNLTEEEKSLLDLLTKNI